MTSHEKRIADGFWTLIIIGALLLIGWTAWEIHTNYINLLVIVKGVGFICVSFAVILIVSYSLGVLVNDVPENVGRWRE